MAITANRELSRYVDQELRSYAVAASAHVWKGALLGIDRTTGHVRNLVAGDSFAGVSYEEVDNSGGTGGARTVRVYTQGDFVLPVTGVAAALAGATVYAQDNEATTVNPLAGGSYCGALVSMVSSGKGIVRIDPLGGSRVEQLISIPLASSLSGATVNPVMITQRAVRLLTAQVSFNTVPGAGALDVGTDNSDPDEVIDAFNLTTLSANTPTVLTLESRDVAKNQRIWAKVGQATTTAGVGGVLTLRFIELP